MFYYIKEPSYYIINFDIKILNYLKIFINYLIRQIISKSKNFITIKYKEK